MAFPGGIPQVGSTGGGPTRPISREAHCVITGMETNWMEEL